MTIIGELESALRLTAGIEAAIVGVSMLRQMQKLEATLRPLVALGENIEQMRGAGTIASCAALTELKRRIVNSWNLQ
jgi:HAMP domain-containing protein